MERASPLRRFAEDTDDCPPPTIPSSSLLSHHCIAFHPLIPALPPPTQHMPYFWPAKLPSMWYVPLAVTRNSLDITAEADDHPTTITSTSRVTHRCIAPLLSFLCSMLQLNFAWDPRPPIYLTDSPCIALFRDYGSVLLWWAITLPWRGFFGLGAMIKGWIF